MSRQENVMGWHRVDPRYLKQDDLSQRARVAGVLESSCQSGAEE